VAEGFLKVLYQDYLSNDCGARATFTVSFPWQAGGLKRGRLQKPSPRLKVRDMLRL